LYNLVKKDGFKWNEEATRKLKNAMAEIPVLTVPDFTQPFTVKTNASNKGLGAGETIGFSKPNSHRKGSEKVSL